MSWFHQLSDGNSPRPPKSSVSRTALESPGVDGVVGVEGAGVADEDVWDGAAGEPPHAATNAQIVNAFRMIPPARFKKRTSSAGLAS